MRRIFERSAAVAFLVLGTSGLAAHAGVEYETEILLIDDASGVAGDYFGYSVAASGDWMAVGTPFDSASGFDAGAVHLYKWEAGEFVQVSSLRPGDLTVSDQFGYDISMDGNLLIVGSPGNDGFDVNSGAVYVYEFDSSGASLKQKLSSFNIEAGEQFGFAVSISGDQLLGGSPYGRDYTTETRGTVTVYELDGGVWDSATLLETSAEGLNIEFGSAIDYDGARAVIGAPFSYDVNGTNGGSAEVFTYYTGFGFDTEGLVYANQTDEESMFGYAVSIDGDFLAVGAPGYNFGTGHVEFFNNDSGTFSNIYQVAEPFDLDFFDSYGHAVHVSGNEVYVGTPYGAGGDVDTGCINTMKIEYSPSSGYSVSEVIRYSLSSMTSGYGYVGYRLDGSGDKIYAGAPNANSSTGTVMYFGEERYWENPAGGFWEDAFNWSGDAVPGASSPVYFGLSNAYNVWTGNLSNVEVASIEVFDGDVTLESNNVGEIYVNGGELGDGLKIGTTNPSMLMIMGQIMFIEEDTSVGLEKHGTFRLLDSYFGTYGYLAIGQSEGGMVSVYDSTMQVGGGVTIETGGLFSIEELANVSISSNSPSDFSVEVIDGVLNLVESSSTYVSGTGIEVGERGYLEGNGLLTFDYNGGVSNTGYVEAMLDDIAGDDKIEIQGGNFLMTGEDNDGNGFEGKLYTSAWDGADASFVSVTYSGQNNGGTAELGGVYQLNVPDTNTVAAGNTFTVLQAESIVDNFSTYLVPYIDENLYFKFNTNLARGRSGGGSSIDGEVADLVIPFGFNPIASGAVTTGEAVSVRAMNVDGDADDDLVILAKSTDSGDAVCVFLNDGGTLCLHAEISVPANPTDMAAADFDNDGDDDLAITCSATNDLVILQNDGGGDFTSILTVNTGANPTALTVFDWNGDGKQDVALVNHDDDTLYVYVNNTTFRSIGFDPPNSSGTSENPSGIAPGDVDPGGGKDEDVVVSGTGGEVTYHINGGGTWSSTELFDTGTTIGSMAVLDLDLVGPPFKDDVFLSYPDSDESGVIYSPTGSLVEDVLPIGGSGFDQVDLDGDGDEDGVFEGPGKGGRGSIAIRVLRNDSDGQPIDVVVFMDVPGDDVSGTSTINTGMDVDGDSHQDLVAISNTSTPEFTINVQTSSNGTSWTPATCATDECDDALPATCPADVSGAGDAPDGFVNVSDLLAVIANWGQTGDGITRPMGDCRPLPNGDCTVNVEDLLGIISEWGATCSP